DGSGREVVSEGIRVLEAAGRRFDLSFSWQRFDWSCERYAKTGSMMPEDGLDQLRPFDAIYLGAVGYPGVADHTSLWGLLIPIRRGFQQYVNLRPVPRPKGVRVPSVAARPETSTSSSSGKIVKENTRRWADGSIGIPSSTSQCSRVSSPAAPATASLPMPSNWLARARSTSPRPLSPMALSTSCPSGTNGSPRFQRSIQK